MRFETVSEKSPIKWLAFPKVFAFSYVMKVFCKILDLNITNKKGIFDKYFHLISAIVGKA
jgi:hypothetical protein